MRHAYFSLGMLANSIRCRLFGTTDLERWSDLDNFEASWSERSRLIAGLVPSGSRVLEFGAGRRHLEGFLDPSCEYIPSDVVDRGPGTLVCDLNSRPLPELAAIAPDVAVFAGVFEYIADLRDVPHWLSRDVSMCIASYECAKSRPLTIARMREAWMRARVGWVNTFDEQELCAMFAASGMACVRRTLWRTPDGDEAIFVFAKLPHTASVAGRSHASAVTAGAGAVRHDYPTRADFLDRLPKDSVGIELGVFKGEFSADILRVAKPKELHLVDAWWTEWGDNYPDWGDYTDFGRLGTKEAYEQTLQAVAAERGSSKVLVHVGDDVAYLEDLADGYLDWSYLDSSHEYEHTKQELEVLRRKTKPNGIITGHDWQEDPTHMHHGVLRAVTEFCATHGWEIVILDNHLQWMIRRRN